MERSSVSAVWLTRCFRRGAQAAVCVCVCVSGNELYDITASASARGSDEGRGGWERVMRGRVRREDDEGEMWDNMCERQQRSEEDLEVVSYNTAS